MLLTTRSSGILSTCPTQLSLLLLMCLTIFSWLISFSNTSFVFCLHSPFVFCVGPKIILNDLLSNTNNFCLMFSVNTQHSDPYTTIGLITVWYSLSLVFLVISLLPLCTLRCKMYTVWATKFCVEQWRPKRTRNLFGCPNGKGRIDPTDRTPTWQSLKNNRTKQQNRFYFNQQQQQHTHTHTIYIKF